MNPAPHSRPAIGIVSDDPSLRARIEHALESSGYVVTFAVTLHQLEKKRPALEQGVVILSGRPHPRNSKGAERVRELFPTAHVIACMPPAKLRGLRLAIDVGVDGIVWDSQLERSLDSAIQAVCAGQLVVPRDSYQRVESPQLTTREKQSLSMVIMGLTNQEIATKLYISEGTVKSHLNSAYRKLGVHSRGEATKLIADPDEGLGTGILAITGTGHDRGRKSPGPEKRKK
jgi:DNA-binding NarL/FixJ family response regulator